MRYRIVQEREDMKTTRYIAEYKGWFFWHPVRHDLHDYILAFKTEEEAEKHILNLIQWNTPVYVKRTIVKEIRG